MSTNLSLSASTVARIQACWDAVARHGADAVGDALSESLTHLAAKRIERQSRHERRGENHVAVMITFAE